MTSALTREFEACLLQCANYFCTCKRR